MAWMVSVTHPMSGLCGGDDASSYGNRFRVGTPDEFGVEGTAYVQLNAGDIAAYQHGGGNGFGPAIQRDPEAVKDDVLDEIISIERAHDKYGVVFTGTVENYDLAVDVAATEELRAAMRLPQAAE